MPLRFAAISWQAASVHFSISKAWGRELCAGRKRQHQPVVCANNQNKKGGSRDLYLVEHTRSKQSSWHPEEQLASQGLLQTPLVLHRFKGYSLHQLCGAACTLSGERILCGNQNYLACCCVVHVPGVACPVPSPKGGWDHCLLATACLASLLALLPSPAIICYHLCPSSLISWCSTEHLNTFHTSCIIVLCPAHTHNRVCVLSMRLLEMFVNDR